ncbi:MAG: tRNA (guanosine(37)-N1)-methyltransferase TrmD [Holosporaceae bacterium]|jgi:tRNA (guanine37-N1)-methyltransferase|nr:tRNA (guanosine(37)-N1)-methyltransferase TrmD [Holosporaceae bacterium]
MWQATVFTIFPEAFPGNLGVSNIGKALKLGLWQLNLVDLKEFPTKSDRIDSTPYGGGAGMLLSPLTFEKAYNSLSAKAQQHRKIYLSPRGRQLRQRDIDEFSASPGIVLLCGRYEGVDQRIISSYEFEEVSIGDFVLMGGEAVAMVIIEGCVRLLPGLVGEVESLDNDSFRNGLLEYDQYTRPREFRGLSVPEELVSGHHEKVKKFRLDQSKKITMIRRPDLWSQYVSSELSKICHRKKR